MVARPRTGRAPRYVPERGDAVWLVFDPQAGHEQAGRRPALVISPRDYNARVGLALMCPITTQQKGYPFEVALAPGGKVTGAILSDQVKSRPDGAAGFVRATLDPTASRVISAGMMRADQVRRLVESGALIPKQ